MGVMNRFMNLLGLQDEEEVVEREKITQDEEQEIETPSFEPRRNVKAANNVVSIHSQKSSNKVVLYEPRSYDEAQEIADHLKNRRSIVVNLQRIRKDQAMRIIDFLSGTVYAVNGTITKLGMNIFMCTPESIEIQGAITEILNSEDEF